MSESKPLPSEIVKHLAYSEESPSGLIWTDTSHVKNKAVKPGDVAGSWDTASRPHNWALTFKRGSYKCNRVIWFCFYGEDPGSFIVDHKDRNRRNNKITNLRLHTYKQSAENRGTWGKVDYKGVSEVSNDSGLFQASFRDSGELRFLGTFENARDAALAWDQACIERGPSHRNLNFPDATEEERKAAVKRRVGRRGVFLDGKKLKGVSRKKDSGKYRSYIRLPKVNGVEGKMIDLGCYPTALEAAQVRDAEIIKRGLPDPLNFPPD